MKESRTQAELLRDHLEKMFVLWEIEGGENMEDPWKYARCIDCQYFGHHGAYCDLQGAQGLCFNKACVFFQWKREKTLRHMDAGYFFPNYEDYRTEMEMRGMEPRRNYNR